ncbi:MAG: 50S ribosomal protein L40e [Nanoarchaeota archaeon]
MVKFPEASARLFKNIFVCRRCKTKMRTTSQRIIHKEILCRRCGGKAFRAIKKGTAK